MLNFKSLKVSTHFDKKSFRLLNHLFCLAVFSVISACGGQNGGDNTEPSSSSGSSSSDGSLAEGCTSSMSESRDSYPSNWTSGELTVFNERGGWTWFNDERAIVDTEAGKLIVGSAAYGGSLTKTGIEVVVHDLTTGQNLKSKLGTLSYSDDSTNPGIIVTAPGEYTAAFAHHNVECKTYWSNYANGTWGDTEVFNWDFEGPECPDGWLKITYNNPWKMSEEGRIYNFVRAANSTPTFLLSEDKGRSWEFGGQLVANPDPNSFNLGYYKYWGDGRDRIDFFATESHPRDSNTSIYHGYLQDGKTYDSFGNVVDENIFDATAPQVMEFTEVFKAGDSLDGAPLNRLWNLDLVRYEDGSIAVLWQGRENQCGKCYGPGLEPEHHLAYSRFDGESWVSTRLVKGGRTTFRDQSDWWEEDHLGGGALDPNDPDVVYVSTNIDPRDDSTDHGVQEIWKGVTCDHGATFNWTPMTMNSVHENLRPTVPAWDEENTALLWFRGNYETAQRFETEVVGIVTREE